MANSVTANTDKVLPQAIAMLSTAVPVITPFTTIIQMDRVEPAKTAEIPIVTAAQAVIENPTTYESHTDTIDNIAVTQTHLSAQFGVNNSSRNAGLSLQMQIATHLDLMQKAILAKIFALFTAANYGTAATVSAAAYAKANFQTLLASVANRSALVLDTGHWVKTERDWFPPGSEGILQECSVWTSAEANVVGFAAQPQAVALAVGYPTVGPSGGIQTRMVRLPIGVDVQMSTWLQLSGRAVCGSLDIVIAPGIGQSGALRLIKSA